MQGIITYWSVAVVLLVITRSFSFVFWIYLEPLICMTYFLAFINYGFHGFLEFDGEGKNLTVVDATAIIEGEDDYFGEDDHMAHHYYLSVYYKDLPAHQKTMEGDFRKYKGSVFRGCSILELSMYIIFSMWDQLADHYVDYTGKMTRDEIKEMLKIRAKRKQISYERYEEYAANPTLEARKELLADIQTFIQENKCNDTPCVKKTVELNGYHEPKNGNGKSENSDGKNESG